MCACWQGTVLTTVGHIKDVMIPTLARAYHDARADNDSTTPEQLSHIVTGLKNWAVR